MSARCQLESSQYISQFHNYDTSNNKSPATLNSDERRTCGVQNLRTIPRIDNASQVSHPLSERRLSLRKMYPCSYPYGEPILMNIIERQEQANQRSFRFFLPILTILIYEW